jgi:hypothetical protein
MDAAALVVELRALTDAGGSYDDQATCCDHLQVASPLPTGAAAEDAVHAVVSALTRGVQHAALHLAACGALTMLLWEAPATSATAGATGVAAALAALRTHPGNADVQAEACLTLSVLAGEYATNRATAGAAGVAAVVGALTRHSSNPGLVWHFAVATLWPA